MSLERAAEVIVKTCMNVQPGEKVLILTDFEMIRIADVIEAESKKITETDLIEIPVGKEHGAEPDDEVAEDMKKYDVIIIPTTKSLTHTNARREASDAGARIATLPGITEEVMERCIDIDYNRLKELHEKLRNLLINSKEFRVVTELGTDITTSVVNTRGDTAGLLHKKGDYENLPTGEVDSGVKEGTTNGKIVVDASFGGLGKLESPITIEVKEGYAVNIEGGEEADRLKERLDAVGKEAYKIAELGV
ncbi:aminopeptidase, partial [Candidatus Woesearchaeota archaeon]|nr:aminopeptidase [Candidatus Woesearchaeota archaeon]